MEKKEIVQQLASVAKKMGFDYLYLSEESRKNLDAIFRTDQPRIHQLRIPDAKVLMEKQEKLHELEKPLRKCQACRLGANRTNLVYGVGNADADIMFIGEGPGHDEDMQGEPFVGKAGRLLTDMITKGMQIRREDVYIANIVKCRPPENRNPEIDEMETCLPNLLEQIKIISPRVIITLGAIPAIALLKDKTGITKIRGRWRSFMGIPLMPTLHPAFLLRNPSKKADVWEDLKQVIGFMNGELEPDISQ